MTSRAPGPAPPDDAVPSRVLVAGPLTSATDVAQALTGRGHLVVRADDVPGPADDLAAAFALDVPDDFDTDAWAAALWRTHPGLPIAFAWSNPGTTSWAPQCSRWLERTTSPVPDHWGWSRRHLGAALPADASAASIARQLVRALDVGDDDPEFVDSLVLAVSELATNAARHGRPPVRLDVVAHGSGVYLGVQDDGSDHLPRRREAHDFEEAGRGLSIVAAVADWWGVTAQADRVLVWCELRRPEVFEASGLAAVGRG